MSLIDLWNSSPTQLREKHVRQVIAFAANGRLMDGNEASQEFRPYLSQIPSSLISRYADECLGEKFDESGLALQDVVNQIGRRLGFTVTDGRYRGNQTQIGFDGLWLSPDNHQIIVEVKTTDAYRIHLNRIADYRRALIRASQVSEDSSSILIVVGRQDTGDLEAQIRGSQHAWDIRLISIEALLRLMKVKEELEDPSIAHKIRDILIPREFTRLDGIIDLVFSTTTDVLLEESTDEEVEEELEERRTVKPKFTPVKFHEACVSRIERHIGRSLLRRSRVIYSSPDGKTAIVCAVSKEHISNDYWFAFHPHQREFLKQAEDPFVAFGCGSPNTLLLIPFADFSQWLNGMHVTRREDKMYWHVSIFNEQGRFVLHRKRGEERIDLTEYLLPESSPSTATASGQVRASEL
jgi:hypothetical protein